MKPLAYVVPPKNPPQQVTANVPCWNKLTGKLTYRGQVVREVAVTAKNVRKLLDVFEEEGWQQHIDSPFPDSSDGQNQLRETIRSLNNNLTSLKFGADGEGTGATWHVLDATNSHDDDSATS